MTDIIGILSVLEGPLAAESKRLWQLFEARYASRGVQSFDYPNLTFQAGTCQDMAAATHALVSLSQALHPFEVIVDSLAYFEGPSKTVFLKVRLTDELRRIHGAVHRALQPCGAGIYQRYLPEQWQPHITLAMDDLTEENFARAWKDFQDYHPFYEQQISNLCLVYMDRSTEHIKIARRKSLR